MLALAIAATVATVWGLVFLMALIVHGDFLEAVFVSFCVLLAAAASIGALWGLGWLWLLALA